MKILAIILLTATIVIAACQPQQQPTVPQPNITPECSSDFDCSAGGCSGQVCATAEMAKRLATTCEYREEYDCLKLTSCGCAEGRCAWKETEAYNGCVDNLTQQ